MAIDDPSGYPAVDRLMEMDEPTLTDYINAASEYIRDPDAGNKKAGQIRLSRGLAAVLRRELCAYIPKLDAHVGEKNVGGGLRNVQADLSEATPLDGVRLAVEIKPVNLAVGRAIWNRFGDIRTFAVNIHLKFPFAVTAGILTVPTYEVTKKGVKRSTRGLIDRAVTRLSRSGRREHEGDAAHLLEAVAVVVYDPDTSKLDLALPPPDSGLRWDEFVKQVVGSYDTRFGGAVALDLNDLGDDTEGDEDDPAEV